MFLRIENTQIINLIGKQVTTSIADDRTVELWRSFMPRRKEITDTISEDLHCVEIYDTELDFENFTIETKYTKLATAPVKADAIVPQGMNSYQIPAGLYAVFIHKGPASAYEPTFNYIFKQWLPASEYQLDKRPHFQVLGSKYKNNEPDSEEEIWIPIKLKN